jgi:hypothetical protein
MTIQSNQSEIVLYKTEDGTVKIDTVFHDETIWLTQKKMAELFDVNIPAISKHLTKIYEEGELEKEATVSKMEIVQKEGNRNVIRNTNTIISVVNKFLMFSTFSFRTPNFKLSLW